MQARFIEFHQFFAKKKVRYFSNRLRTLLINRSIDLWKVTCISSLFINCSYYLFDLRLPSLAANTFFCFSNHQGAGFFFFLLLSFQSSFLWHHEEGNLFSEYNQSKWLFYIGYYLKEFTYLLYVQEILHLLIIRPFNLLHFQGF